jgi:hypothetical protein
MADPRLGLKNLKKVRLESLATYLWNTANRMIINELR